MLTIIRYMTGFLLSVTGAYVGITVLTEPLFIFWSGVITAMSIIVVNFIFESIKERSYNENNKYRSY